MIKQICALSLNVKAVYLKDDGNFDLNEEVMAIALNDDGTMNFICAEVDGSFFDPSKAKNFSHFAIGNPTQSEILTQIEERKTNPRTPKGETQIKG